MTGQKIWVKLVRSLTNTSRRLLKIFSQAKKSILKNKCNRMYYSKGFLLIYFTFFLCCKNEQITYYSDVKKIIDDKCSSCHNKNGAGPFELTEFSQIKKKEHL